MCIISFSNNIASSSCRPEAVQDVACIMFICDWARHESSIIIGDNNRPVITRWIVATVIIIDNSYACVYYQRRIQDVARCKHAWGHVRVTDARVLPSFYYKLMSRIMKDLDLAHAPTVNLCDQIRSFHNVHNIVDRVVLLGVYTVRSSDRPVCPTGLSDQSDEAFTRSDRRTDRSVRPRLRPTVCQTSQTDRSDRL